MSFLVIVTLLYFLPSLIGLQKRHSLAIFLTNFFLGWTIVGWFVVLLWAVGAAPNVPDVYIRNQMVPVAAGPSVQGGLGYCNHCGAPHFHGAQFCSVCGKLV
jgi:hypothetical protein